MDMKQFYDTLYFWPKNGQAEIVNKAMKKKINFRYYSDGHVSHYYICCQLPCYILFSCLSHQALGALRFTHVHTSILRSCFLFQLNNLSSHKANHLKSFTRSGTIKWRPSTILDFTTFYVQELCPCLLYGHIFPFIFGVWIFY